MGLIGVPFYCYDKDYNLQTLKSDSKITIKTNRKNCYIDLDDNIRIYGLHPNLPKIGEEERNFLDFCIKHDIYISTDFVTILKNVYNVEELSIKIHKISFARDMQIIILFFMLDNENITAVDKILKEKEDKTNMMDNMLNKMRFGKAGKDYSLTMFGTIAYKNKTYINGEIQEVEGMTMPFDMIFAVPTQVIQAGDLIERDANSVIYITKVEKDGTYQGISLTSGTVIDYVPKTYFGLKMYTKIVNPLTGGFNFGTDANGLLNGNAMMNMIMMQSLLGNDSSYGNSGDNKILMMMMMMGGNNPFMNMFNAGRMPVTSNTKNE